MDFAEIAQTLIRFNENPDTFPSTEELVKLEETLTVVHLKLVMMSLPRYGRRVWVIMPERIQVKG